MTYYKVYIDCVDGETLYMMGSPSKAALLEFLKRLDHEGSGLTLEVFDDAEISTAPPIYDEAVYGFLQESK